jgi:hypothetical protein
MKVLIEPGKSKNVLVTIAIGDSYFDSWSTFALPAWREYCTRHDLGLVAFDQDQIPQSDRVWKKATWQKLLIGESLESAGLKVENVCYADTDILINPEAPNIFDSYNRGDHRPRLDQEESSIRLALVQRRLAFLRHNHYDSAYPLDSALFMSVEQLYEFHGLPVQPDEACMGLIVFNVPAHAKLMRGWFDKYDRNVQSVTGGGDQTHVNFEIQNWGGVSWLDYRFQAMWVYEMAWKFPFLYHKYRDDVDLIRECIEASLYSNYFLHFAGSWHESELWKKIPVFTGSSRELLKKYSQYLSTPVTGQAKGQIKPAKS